MIVTIMWYTGFLLQFVQGFFFYKCLTYIVEPRKSRIVKMINWVLASAVCAMVIYPNDVVNITVLFPIFIFMLLVGFHGEVLTKVSVVLLFFPIIVAFNFLQGDFGLFVFKQFTDRSDTINYVLSTSFFSVSILFWYLFMRILRHKNRELKNILDQKSWLLLDIICLASLAAVISCVYFTPEESYKVWPCMLACILTNIGSIRLAYYLAGTIRAEHERRNLKLKKDYYEELEQNQQNLRRFRHDIHNHFIVAAGLLEEEKPEEAAAYIQKLSGQFASKGRVFCKNSIVNAVVNAKYNRACEAGIDCFVHIEIDRLLFVDDVDICTIFSNTLDNAIEACMQIEDTKGFISMKARCTKNRFFSFEIKNSRNGQIPIHEVKGRFQSKKQNEKDHGIGLENVKEVVARYEGTMDISYTEEEFQVVILISEESGL